MGQCWRVCITVSLSSNEWVSVVGCAERSLSLSNGSVLAGVQNGISLSPSNEWVSVVGCAERSLSLCVSLMNGSVLSGLQNGLCV